MYSEECQIQTLSSKNGKISEKTSSNDAKSTRREWNFNRAVKFNRRIENLDDEVRIETMNFGGDITPYFSGYRRLQNSRFFSRYSDGAWSSRVKRSSLTRPYDTLAAGLSWEY